MKIFRKIKRKVEQIKQVIYWLPIIWKSRDWDSFYSIEMFQSHLKRMSKYFEKQSKEVQSAKHKMNRINLILDLMDKVYNEYYITKYQDKIKEKYGDYAVLFVPTNHNKTTFKMETKWDRGYSEEELKQISEEEKVLLVEGIKQNNKAHKILWALVEHNIQSFWD